MLILFVVSHYRIAGGHEKVISSLAKGLSKLGHEVILGAISFEKDPPNEITTVRLNRFKNIPEIIDSNKRVDIIHSQHTKMNYYSLLTSKPFIFHFHGTGNKIQELNLKLSFVLCKNKISKIIYTSNSSLLRTRKIVGSVTLRIPYEIIRNGVDTILYHDGPKKYKIGDPQLLFVGNLYRHKNVERIIREMPHLFRSFPSVHLQIVGHGECYNELREFIHKKNLQSYVELVGSVNDEEELRLRYSSCDIYVSASTNEANPVPLLEAMACSKPVLVSDIPPHKEVVEISNAGATFALADSHGIEKGMVDILRQKSTLENNARIYAVQNDWSNVCKKISNIYQDLIG